MTDDCAVEITSRTLLIPPCRMAKALAAGMALAGLALLGAGPAGAAPLVDTVDRLSPADENGRFVHLIEFAEPGALHRVARGPRERFDPNTPEAQAQLQQVMAEQAQHVARMAGAVGRELEVTHYFTVTHSGLAARLTPEEAQTVSGLPGVVSVERERLYELSTFRGPWFIGADQVWDGTSTPDGLGTMGEDMVIAVLDTGIAPTHPSFANVAACGHGGPNPNKLISFLDCSQTDGAGLCNGPTPTDSGSHGTHVISTAGGNMLDDSAVPAPFMDISGVAPCAHIRSYRVCPTTCPGAQIQAGMTSVLLHGDVSVMNFSISGGLSPWVDNDRRKLDLLDAGVLVAAAAGNTSAGQPNPVGNVNHRGPWVLTVAASTHDGAGGLVSASGPGVPPPSTQNIAATRGSDSPVADPMTDFPIRYFTGQNIDEEGCNVASPPFPAGFFNGAAALIRRGTCTFTEKITNAFNAGAEMVIIRNNQPGDLSMATPGQPNIPAYSILQAPGDALATFVAANPGSATIDFEPTGDVLAGFSLRGPTPAPLQNLTKPDITAPGVSIYAAVPGGYGNSSGTSMSSPHAAGAATLVRAVRPAWTVSEVKSAMMMTAFKGGTKENGVTPWNADDVGSGRVDLTKAALAGLVMDEIFANYLAANPAAGGDVRTLNLPAVRDMDCTPSCSWTRTVRNTLDVPTSWTATGNAITPGFIVGIQPSSFAFSGNLGETQELTITATPITDLTAAVAFGEVVLSEGGGLSPDLHITVAIRGEGTPDGPIIDVAPTSLSATLPADQTDVQVLTISNIGTQDLDWEIFEELSAIRSARAVIWNQPTNGGSGIVSDYFTPLGSGVYSADDFQITASASIDRIFTEGFWNAGNLANATAITWYIYPDNGGQPAGHPEDGLGLHVWTYSDAPAGTGINIADNNIDLDVVAATGDTIDLGPGTYWLLVFPTINSSVLNDRWNWFQSAQQLSQAHLVDPGNLFGGGFTSWTSFGAIGVTFTGVNFLLEGTVQVGCPDGDIPWLSVSPTSGTTVPSGSTPVNVTFDSTGLAPGTHQGELCIESNDSLQPVVVVPVELTVVVGNQPIADISPTSFEFEVFEGDGEGDVLEVGNVGTAPLVWSITTDAPAASPDLQNAVNDFEGYFAIPNWTLVNNPPGVAGSFNTNPGPPVQLFVVGGNANVGGDTDFQIEIPKDGVISFNWGYQSTDTGNWDRGGYAINGVFTQLANNATQVPYFNGSATVPVSEGDTFAFRVHTVDGQFGAGTFGVTNFQFAPDFEACDDPTAVTWLDVDPDSGVTPPAGSTPVDVTVDSTGLSPGNYQAALCVETNDPSQPLVVVPVELTVMAAVPIADISPSSFEFEVVEGESDTQILNVGNVGVSDLVWIIETDQPSALAGSGPSVTRRGVVQVVSARGSESPRGPLSLVGLEPERVRPPAPPFGAAWAPAAALNPGRVRYAQVECPDDLNRFYVFGGVDSGFSVTDNSQRYDAATNTWAPLAALPSPEEGPAGVCYQGKIYVAGGGGTTAFRIYDIATNDWSSGAPLPRGMWGAAMGAWDGKVFMVGGAPDFAFSFTDEVDIYDIATNTWNAAGQGTPMPTGAVASGFVQLGRYVYVVGGWGSASPGANVNMSMRYDMQTDTWSTGPTFTSARSDFALAGNPTALYAIGGDADGGGAFDATNLVERLELAGWPGGSWQPHVNLPQALTAYRGGFATAAVVGGEVWSTGGFGGGVVVGTNQYLEAEGFVCADPTAVPWLDVTPDSGVTPPSGSVPVDVTVDASGLAAGDYEAHLCISTNDPAQPLVVVPIELTVLEDPCPVGPTHLVLENVTLSGTEVYEACSTITAGPNFTITSTGDVTFRAGHTIILRSGVEIETGAKFVGEIDPGLKLP
jgi:hypothetical protein